MIVFVVGGILILMFIVVSLQMANIRSRISELSHVTFDKENAIYHRVNNLISDNSKLRVYSITLDVKGCDFAFNVPPNVKNSIFDALRTETIALPYVCNKSFRSIDTRLLNVAIMVLKSTVGSNHLIKDLQNKNITYVIIDRTVFLAKYMFSLTEIFREHFKNTNNTNALKHFEDQHVIALCSVADHVITDQKRSEFKDDNCVFAMQPFFGEFKEFSTLASKNSSATAFIDIIEQVIGKTKVRSSVYHSMHIMGYRG